MTSTPDDIIPETTPAFRDLGLPDALLRATVDLGFEFTTEIQALTLPAIVAGRDVAAQAQTGTGKTAAFLLGSFSRLLAADAADAADPDTVSDARQPDQPRMLVIAPTRELAIQIAKDAEALARHTSLSAMVVYGGIDYEKQRTRLAEGVDVLIGTPGRLIDYYKQRVFNLKRLKIVVLDEADRMFDLGFIADIRYLLRQMPPPGERTSMLFSATLSHRVMELAYEHMNDPETIKTETTGVTADGVRQMLFHPATDEKIGLLLGLIRDLEPPRSIVFVNTKRAAERVESYLVGNDIRCGTLSGDVRQNKRQAILAEFTAGTLPVLIATDVAARGLHIDDVTHVFNYDLPQQAEDYVHRIGRTARAGSQGVAVSFACENYSFSLPEIQEFIGQMIPLEPITDELIVKPKRPARIERDRVPPRPGERGAPGRRPPVRKDGGRSGQQSGRNARGAAKPAAAGSRSADTANPAAVAARRANGGEAHAVTDAASPMPAAATTADGAGPATATDAPKKRRRRRGKRRPGGDASAIDGDTTVTSGPPPTTGSGEA